MTLPNLLLHEVLLQDSLQRGKPLSTLPEPPPLSPSLPQDAWGIFLMTSKRVMALKMKESEQGFSEELREGTEVRTKEAPGTASEVDKHMVLVWHRSNVPQT